MFEVQSHKLIRSLVKLAQELQQKLVTWMLEDLQKINKTLVGFAVFSFSPHNHLKKPNSSLTGLPSHLCLTSKKQCTEKQRLLCRSGVSFKITIGAIKEAFLASVSVLELYWPLSKWWHHVLLPPGSVMNLRKLQRRHWLHQLTLRNWSSWR